MDELDNKAYRMMLASGDEADQIELAKYDYRVYMAKLGSGDAMARSQFTEYYLPRIMSYVGKRFRITKEEQNILQDITHETLVKLYERLPVFRNFNEHQMGAYVIRTAFTTGCDYFKKERREHPKEPLQESSALASSDEHDSAELSASQTGKKAAGSAKKEKSAKSSRKRVKKKVVSKDPSQEGYDPSEEWNRNILLVELLGKLKNEQWRRIVLAHADGHGFDQIGRDEGMKADNARKINERALTKMRKLCVKLLKNGR